MEGGNWILCKKDKGMGRENDCGRKWTFGRSSKADEEKGANSQQGRKAKNLWEDDKGKAEKSFWKSLLSKHIFDWKHWKTWKRIGCFKWQKLVKLVLL